MVFSRHSDRALFDPDATRSGRWKAESEFTAKATEAEDVVAQVVDTSSSSQSCGDEEEDAEEEEGLAESEVFCCRSNDEHEGESAASLFKREQNFMLISTYSRFVGGPFELAVWDLEAVRALEVLPDS